MSEKEKDQKEVKKEEAPKEDYMAVRNRKHKELLQKRKEKDAE